MDMTQCEVSSRPGSAQDKRMNFKAKQSDSNDFDFAFNQAKDAAEFEVESSQPEIAKRPSYIRGVCPEIDYKEKEISKIRKEGTQFDLKLILMNNKFTI